MHFCTFLFGNVYVCALALFFRARIIVVASPRGYIAERPQYFIMLRFRRLLILKRVVF